MSEMWVDAEEYEDIGEGAYDSEDMGEGAYDSDDGGEEFAEESRSARRRREQQRQRQIMLARQRQAQMRRRRRSSSPARRPVGAAGPSRQTITAVRSLDLETKVGLDSLRRAVEESNRRANRATWAAVAGTAVDQGLDSFRTNLTNQYVRAGARFAPLLFLSPAKKKGGAEGFVTDPRVIGGASILGIALLHNLTSTVHSVDISPVGTVTGKGTLDATAKGRLGITVPNVVFTWGSGNPGVLDFPDTSKGDFTYKVKAPTGATTQVGVTAEAPNGVKGTLILTVAI
jgi:hypothetical protein